MKSSGKAWFLAIRPKTLTAALIPIGVGFSLSYLWEGQVRPGLTFLALCSALLIQIGTNFINDALDFKKGADTAERMGPQRATQSGWISPVRVWWGGIFCFFLATVFALPLVLAAGWPLILIGILSLMAGYAYTGGPYPLAYVGLGDLFVLIFFGWVAVGGIYFLNTGHWSLPAFVAGSQIGLLATVLIAINNFRDARTDRKVHKRTLAVRWGAVFSRYEIAVLAFLPFLGGIYWLMHGFTWAAFLPLLSLPLAIRLVRRIFGTEPGPVYNQFLAQSAALHLLFGILLSWGFCLHA